MQSTPPPSLLGFVQDSFERYLQTKAPAQQGGYLANADYQEQGLHAVFKRVFPITAKDQCASLEYVMPRRRHSWGSYLGRSQV